MTVYVDALVDWGYGAVKEVPYARNWCHMFADSLDELHSFAERIGMRREWFQDHNIPHYDLTKTRRVAAIKAGAIPFEPTLADLKRFKDLLRKEV